MTSAGVRLGLPSTAAAEANGKNATDASLVDKKPGPIEFPRVFTGRRLARISFPLGGVGTGCIGLGGRGNLQDWEIFNHPDVGRVPAYCFPTLWVKAQGAEPVSRVLERRFLPPYDLGPENFTRTCGAGLPRLRECTFRGAFPLAAIEFHDEQVPVRISLEAFSSVVPVDAERSSLPVAILDYSVRNPSRSPAEVVIAWSCDNPVGGKGRVNEVRRNDGLDGVFMTNPTLAPEDAARGSVAMAVLTGERGSVASLRPYWERNQWNVGEGQFWYDAFAPRGELGPDPISPSPTASVSLRRTIAPNATEHFRFFFTWHFPVRTPAGCGWEAPKGEGSTNLGNYYCTRFADAWAVAEYVQSHFEEIAKGTRAFARALSSSTLPAPLLEAASANLSTLVSSTVFRTADGSFHGFEGCGDKLGMGFGSCTHVWNYEAATALLYPELARSMRETSFGYATDDLGHMDFRHKLPMSREHWGAAAADGQMGQIIKLYQDWRVSGNTEWLKTLWPACKRAMMYAWRVGGWDAHRQGVMDGVQHNTYDIEFYGPNPLCSALYLGALQACARMGETVGDAAFGLGCLRLYQAGRTWFDNNLFNGEFYVQQVRSIPAHDIADGLRLGDGAVNSLQPDFQVGTGCLLDQLLGQYLAELAGLGTLLDEGHIRKTLAAFLKYNYRPSMQDHPCTMRAFAVNDQRALVLCDYSRGGRPEKPFPYFAENFTGSEYAAAALMLRFGLTAKAVECVANVRMRYDGEHANPYSEAEYGRHYARAMASWSLLPIFSGFHYDAVDRSLRLQPKTSAPHFLCFWSAGTAWGSFTQQRSLAEPRISIHVQQGTLQLREMRLDTAMLGSLPCELLSAAGALSLSGAQSQRETVLSLPRELSIGSGEVVTIQRKQSLTRAH